MTAPAGSAAKVPDLGLSPTVYCSNGDCESTEDWEQVQGVLGGPLSAEEVARLQVALQSGVSRGLEVARAGGTCRTCEHWHEGAQASIYPGADPTLGNCSKIGDVDERDALAVAVGGEGLSAWLQTRSEFGCVLHEARLLR